MWPTYKAYCKHMKKLKTVPLPEEIWRREYGPKDETHREPLIITPKNRQRPMSATFDNHIADVGKTIMPKKKYAPRISRSSMTPEQIRARKAQNVRNCKARKKQSRNDVIL